MDDDQDLVLLRECADSMEAARLRAVLESAGIDSVTQGGQHRALFGTGVFGHVIEVKMLVAPRDFDRANQLVVEMESNTDTALAEAAAENEQNLPESTEAEPDPEEGAEAEQGTRTARWIWGITGTIAALLLIWFKYR